MFATFTFRHRKGITELLCCCYEDIHADMHITWTFARHYMKGSDFPRRTPVRRDFFIHYDLALNVLDLVFFCWENENKLGFLEHSRLLH